MNPHDVILRPVLSEKALSTIAEGRYAFYVHPHTNRRQIREALETVFNVEVIKINLLNVRGKEKTMGRYKGFSPARKKAIVTLREGQRIQQLEGLM
jgi:large subunit ribosomal protein L23